MKTYNTRIPGMMKGVYKLSGNRVCGLIVYSSQMRQILTKINNRYRYMYLAIYSHKLYGLSCTFIFYSQHYYFLE